MNEAIILILIGFFLGMWAILMIIEALAKDANCTESEEVGK